MKIVIYFSFIFSLFTQEKISLSEQPTNPEYLQVSEFNTLKGGLDGYYDWIQAKYYKEKFYVYDGGNKKLFCYNLNGKELFSFGKEGNGPGEFTPMYRLSAVTSDRIIVAQWDRMSIFKLDGTYLTDIKLNLSAYTILFKEDEIVFKSNPGKIDGDQFFDYNGNKIRETANKNKEEIDLNYNDLTEVKQKLVSSLDHLDGIISMDIISGILKLNIELI